MGAASPAGVRVQDFRGTPLGGAFRRRATLVSIRRTCRDTTRFGSRGRNRTTGHARSSLRGLSIGRGFDSRRLHHFCLSKHSLSLRTRLTERRVLACNSLILASFGVADLRTAHPFFAPLERPKPPFGPLFLCFLRTSANPSVGRESSIYAGFSTLDFLGVRFGHADHSAFRTPVRALTARRLTRRVVSSGPGQARGI